MAFLPFRTKLGYGFGHVLNDLSSAMWFSYLLLYFHHVLLFPNTLAGVILFIGQIADALSTPFVGHEADRTDDLPICVSYGRRKTWHLIGTLCVSFTFAFVFLGCIGCSTASPWAQVFYYTPFVVIFQFGWASTQISHLAILPHLSPDPHDRTELNAIRYAFSVMSTITVYCITWLILGLNKSSVSSVLGPSSSTQFMYIVGIVLAIGFIFSFMFHILIKEDSGRSFHSIDQDENHVAAVFIPMKSKDWLKEPQFYQIGALYMATRLFSNLIQAYIPLYLQDTLILDEQSIAYIPLVMYVSGLATTIGMKSLNRFAGRKITFLVGCVLGGSGAIWVFFGIGELFSKYLLYVVAILLGSGASTMLVTSLSITADMIGSNIECGAFVYGCMSFTDKLSNGVIVLIIQYFTPCMSDCPECKSYFRDVITFAGGGAALLGIIVMMTLLPVKIGERKKGFNSASDSSKDVLINAGASNEEKVEYNGGYSVVNQREEEAGFGQVYGDSPFNSSTVLT